MKKVKIVEQKIRLSSILALEIEVNGISRQDENGTVLFSIPGILSQKMSAATKYWLTKLGTFLSKERKNYEDIRAKLIEKYGEEKTDPKSGNKFYSVEQKVKDPDFVPPVEGDKDFDLFDAEAHWPIIDNVKLKQFREEEQELLKQLVDVKLPKFDIQELFAFETEYSYTVSCELLVQEDDENFQYSDIDYSGE
jgi:hypothetical protein